MVSEIVEISDMTLREIRPAMASSGEGTNDPTAADGDKLEELLAAPGCCSGWQGQALLLFFASLFSKWAGMGKFFSLPPSELQSPR